MPLEPAGAYEALTQFLYRAPIGLVQTTLDGTIEMINPMSASLLMPLSCDGNLDNLFVVLERVAPQLRGLIQAFEPSSGPVCESVRLSLSASAHSDIATQVLSISVLKLDEARLMAMVSDVSLEVQREESALVHRLDAAARIDSLTQMPNRIVIRDQIQRAIGRGRTIPGNEFAVLFMNGDRFKQINDSLGHLAGDELIRLMADRLRTTLREHHRRSPTTTSEPLAGRLGGDEFVVLLHDMRSSEEVDSVAGRLVDVLSLPYSVLAHQLHLSVSMGVVIGGQVNADADSILRDSSIAMVEAKRGGGGRYVVFEPSMHERASRRGDVERDLRRALLDEQLFVVYQPVVALKAVGPYSDLPDYAAGIEALVRWRHPVRGVVPPVEFIDVAEECGLIGALGEFVLKTACHRFVKWRQTLGRMAPRLLAVNLSRAQLSDPDLVDLVGSILRSTGIQPSHLQLEVTESLAAQDRSVRARLQELKALGLTLALDDFGTGYSSLASLHELPVDTVKIDRSFVREAVVSAHHRVLIEATVRVANSLRMSTVAEGVETEDQATLVRELGCDKGQGYFFSKALSKNELVDWLTSKAQLQNSEPSVMIGSANFPLLP